MISVTVPVHSHIKKYLLHRFNSTTGRITASTQIGYGITILKIFQKKSPFDSKEVKVSYAEKISIEFSDYFSSHSGLYISNKNIALLNQAIKDDFEKSLFNHIMINIASNKDLEIETEILKYLAYFNINEEELKLDSLKKSFYRWRKERNYLIHRA